MTAKLNSNLLAEVKKLLNEKVAFVPMPGGDPGMAAGGMPPPGAAPADPAMAGAPMDPAMAGGMPPPGAAPLDPALAGGLPPAAPAPAPAPQTSGMITMSSDELLKFVKQIVALCTNGKFGVDQPGAAAAGATPGLDVINAKLDSISGALQG